MKKEIVGHRADSAQETHGGWLDLEPIARVRLTSEDPEHPIESALQPERGSGWRAAGPGAQTIWLHFSAPQAIREIHLRFEAAERRTQEFVLLVSMNGGESYRELVRQQFNFSPDNTAAEEESYFPNLTAVTDLKLTIVPDISGGETKASLRRLRIR